MKTTLVTGHRGFIGSLLFNPETMVGLDIKDGFNLLSSPLPHGIQTIYHLAAQTSVESSWTDPLHDLDNIRMVARLVQEYPLAQIIYADSAASIERKSPYGFSKWAGAAYLKQFHNNYVICRLPNVYGEGSKSVVDIFRKTNSVVIYGDGEQKRDYVHVSDIVRALQNAKNWPGGEYELGSGKGTTVNELAIGKDITYAPARQESRESILKNSTPDWDVWVDVRDYMSGFNP